MYEIIMFMQRFTLVAQQHRHTIISPRFQDVDGQDLTTFSENDLETSSTNQRGVLIQAPPIRREY